MLTSLRTYRLPAAIAVLAIAFGVLVPLAQHVCAWVDVNGMMASIELPCHDEATDRPVSHEADLPYHDTGTDGVQLEPGSSGRPDCCLIAAEQPVVEGVRISTPVLEHVIVLSPGYTVTLPDEEQHSALSARDTGPERPPSATPLHILHASLLI